MSAATPDATLIDALHRVPELDGIVHDAASDKNWNKLIRPWNVRCAPTPLAVVVASTAQQVSATVRFGAQHGLAVQARSGGHSYGSFALGGADGALVVDLSPMDQVIVDPVTDPDAVVRAEIGAGTRLGRVSEELFRQGGRAIAHGTCPDVGIGGHATIGGQGPLSRLWGLCLDHVVQAEVVLADGTIKTVDAEHDSDLFWAIRGAGASFAIVTKFIVGTHAAVTETEYYTLRYTLGPPAALSGAFQAWQAYLLQPATLADRRFNSVISFTADSFVVRGSRLAGPGPHAERLASELDVHVGAHLEVKKSWTLDWLAHAEQWAQDEVFNFFGGKPTSQYLKSMTVGKDQPLSKAATDAMFRYLHGASPGHGLLWFVLADFELGAIADPAPDATAYVHRDVLYTLAAYVIDPVPGRAFPAAGLAFLDGWTHALTAAAPANAFGVYPGYVDPALAPAPAARAYWGANLPRLAELKRRYDPGEVFRNPQSVRPMRAPGDPALDEDEEKPRPAQNRNRRYCNCEIA